VDKSRHVTSRQLRDLYHFGCLPAFDATGAAMPVCSLRTLSARLNFIPDDRSCNTAPLVLGAVQITKESLQYMYCTSIYHYCALIQWSVTVGQSAMETLHGSESSQHCFRKNENYYGLRLFI